MALADWRVASWKGIVLDDDKVGPPSRGSHGIGGNRGLPRGTVPGDKLDRGTRVRARPYR